MASSPQSWPWSRARGVWPIVLPAALLAWLLAWVFHFGTTLINDEYLAIDYFYRIVRLGRAYPTPDAFHKPLSVLMGFFAWLTESPLGYEAAVAVFGVIFVVVLYFALRRELGASFALAAAVAVSLHPDLMYYTARGSTVIPFCAFTFAALLAAHKRDEKWSLWVYAGSLFLAGLIRAEPWVLAAPALYWWWPRHKSARAWAGLFAALCLIGLAPVIWLGKDYFINHDLMHGFKVAIRVRVVGMGQPFSLLDALLSFWLKVPNKVSWPVVAGAVAGAVLFVKEKGLRPGLMHPLIVFPALVSVFLAAVVYLGVYPNPWYFYFDSVFAIIFCLNFFRTVIPRIKMGAGRAAWTAIMFAAIFIAIAMFLARGGGGLTEGRWLLIAASLICAALAAVLARPEGVLSRPRETFLIAALTLISLSFPLMAHTLYQSEIDELRLEAAKQREMAAVAEFLRREIPEGRGGRIMLPSRRNEQLSWLFRDREPPDTVALREAFYLSSMKHIDFLDLHPDWIIYIPADYHFRGPENMFRWLGGQDQTELNGVKISLVMSTGHIRVFKVTYRPGHAPRGPLPPIP
ncbi:MAG TPA: glycosyltransferase family 39 protein [bacterium]|nr:glycosyltransferase family 39 protein [bacterium]